MGLNFAVAAGKGAYGLATGSVTLGADAFHSVLDGSANVLALVGMHFAAAPADEGHPYGHRKFEVLAAVGIGVLIAVSLLELAGAAWQALVGRRAPPNIGWDGFVLVLAAMAINLFVSRYEARKARELGSPLLAADARHTQSDLFALGAVLLSFVATSRGLWWADGVCAALVMLLVGRTAWVVVRDNVPSLVDAAVVNPVEVHAVGITVDGVQSIHGVRSRGSKWAVELDLHMQVAGDMKVEDAHHLAHRVEDTLRAHLSHVSDVVIHIEPSPTKKP